jgi:hypothetical protein
MTTRPFHLADEPTESSVSLLVSNLGRDSATKGVSSKIYAHRSRVIRQQSNHLSLRVAAEADENSKVSAKRARKANRSPDHRDEGGEG